MALRAASAAWSVRLDGRHVDSAGSGTTAGPVLLSFPAAFERDCSDGSPEGADRGADASTRNCLPGPPPPSRSKAGGSGDEGSRSAWCNRGRWTEGFWPAVGWSESFLVYSAGQLGTTSAAPIYLKFGVRNAPGLYPSGQHIESTVAALSRELELRLPDSEPPALASLPCIR